MEFEIVTSGKKYALVDKNGEVLINGNKEDYSVIWRSDKKMILYRNQQAIEIELLGQKGKTFEIKVGERIHQVEVKDHLDLILDQLGLNDMNKHVINEIVAPMPGSILKVFVQPGQKVVKGDHLIILEAMKMENIIKSPISGIIKSVSASEGANVEKNHSLIEFE
ncbi:MAG: acetyl-CoA carboxylase biotin carboxyl carrier protein subunit [Cyclobacteriaceae bacterium]